VAIFSTNIAPVPEMTNCLEKKGTQRIKFSDRSMVGRYAVYCTFHWTLCHHLNALHYRLISL